jgi:hypothetical protein
MRAACGHTTHWYYYRPAVSLGFPAAFKLYRFYGKDGCSTVILIGASIDQVGASHVPFEKSRLAK